MAAEEWKDLLRELGVIGVGRWSRSSRIFSRISGGEVGVSEGSSLLD